MITITLTLETTNDARFPVAELLSGIERMIADEWSDGGADLMGYEGPTVETFRWS